MQKELVLGRIEDEIFKLSELLKGSTDGNGTSIRRARLAQLQSALEAARRDECVPNGGIVKIRFSLEGKSYFLLIGEKCFTGPTACERRYE